MSSPGQNGKAGPLSGIRVLDLSRVLAGPWATQLLGDYGADVIKVEVPGDGDDTRRWGPPWVGRRSSPDKGDSAYFHSTNRNKRSLTVDLGRVQGADVIRRLASHCDVLVENFRTGTAERFGIDHASLKPLNPGLVYCSISAYGREGSRASYPGYDAMIQAEGGLMSVTGAPDAEGGGPTKVGVAVADIMAGMYAVSAIIAALLERSETGEGQYIDVPLFDSQVAWLANQNMNYLVGGVVPERMGTAHPNLVPYRAFPTADGHIMLAVGNNSQFRRCMQCLGCPDLADDPRFHTNADRIGNRLPLEAELLRRFGSRTTAEWLEILGAAAIPAGPINTIREVFESDLAREKGLVRQVAHALAGQVPTVANPVRFSRTPVSYRRASPLLGEHSREILAEVAGLCDSEIDALGEAGVI